MNVPPEKGVFTRREALAIVAGSAVTAVVMVSSAPLLARTFDVEGPPTGAPPPLTDQSPPLVLSF